MDGPVNRSASSSPTRRRWIDWLYRTLRWFSPRRSLGDRGERAAARFLKRQGYKIVARGYSNAYGELDVVAVDGRTVVFVEVKTRVSTAGGHPAEAVTAEKQRRLRRAALGFLRHHGLWGTSHSL